MQTLISVTEIFSNALGNMHTSISKNYHLEMSILALYLAAKMEKGEQGTESCDVMWHSNFATIFIFYNDSRS